MVKKILVQNFFFGKQTFGSTKKLWCGKILCPKIFVFPNIWVPKKSLVKIGSVTAEIIDK